MNTKQLVLPALCLGGAALLFAPLRSTQAFNKIGGSLSENQRDVRVFDNFADVNANNNTTPSPQFPGWTGVELAIWKATIEWSSRLHGDGTGDPQNGNLLGSGGANFDPFWAGNASAIGTANTNIVSAITTCGGGGTLAFTETPISDGWRIRVCDEWNWDDGPGSIQNRFDIQGVICHEYGHALGLSHSTVPGTTMSPAIGAGSTAFRSIENDDTLGVQCIYGVASASKPTITATVASAGTLTIYGSNYGATNNEVWFTNNTITATAGDPIVRVTGVSSTGGGTVVTVTIPGLASPGDVIVKKPGSGGATLSNAFPTDLVGTFGNPPLTHPSIASVSPSLIDALIPGTAHTITISGSNLTLTTDVTLDTVSIAPSRYTIVNNSSITLDMPQASSLGIHTLAVTDGVVTSPFSVQIVEPATPQYELGTGDAGNVVDRTNGLTFIISGTVGSVHRVYGSSSNLPSSNAFVSLGIGNNFTDVSPGGTFTIPNSGWLQITIPTDSLPDPGVNGTTYYSQNIVMEFPAPLPVSNVQQIFLIQ